MGHGGDARCARLGRRGEWLQFQKVGDTSGWRTFVFGGVQASDAGFDELERVGQVSAVLVAFHKPWGVLSQFTEDGSSNRPLKEFGFPPRVYPIGRLDADSEGLLLLSDEAHWTERLLDPRQAHPRRYWVQVEGIPTVESLTRLQQGVEVQGRRTMPARAWLLEPQPEIPPRDPPIRVRLSVPDRWLALELVEGRNRQVRRMTAAIGHPTLRLIRVRIGAFELGDLGCGGWKIMEPVEERAVLSNPQAGVSGGSRRPCSKARATLSGRRFLTEGKA